MPVRARKQGVRPAPKQRVHHRVQQARAQQEQAQAGQRHPKIARVVIGQQHVQGQGYKSQRQPQQAVAQALHPTQACGRGGLGGGRGGHGSRWVGQGALPESKALRSRGSLVDGLSQMPKKARANAASSTLARKRPLK